MVNTKTPLLSLVFIAFVITAVPACNNRTCNEYEIHSYPGGKDYYGFDTLKFLHNSFDTQVFVGQGNERFYVETGISDEGDCPDKYESERLRFVNPKTKDEIVSEFRKFPREDVYGYGRRFYYKNKIIANLEVSNELLIADINGATYNRLSIYSLNLDTITYLLFNHSKLGSPDHGIVKIKFPGDTLTLIR